MDYAQARIQARFGERPDESVWQAIRNTHEPAALLDIARSCGLRRWTAGLDAASGTHAIEISLRSRWRECVTELASWMPSEWRESTLWISGLADLPALCHLARGEAPLAWMSQDPILRPYLIADAGERQTRVRQHALAFAALPSSPPAVPDAPDDDIDMQVRHAWRDEWRRRWPVRREAKSIDALVALVESGAREPLATGRPALLRRLRSRFRELALRPAAAFVFLALVAFDIGRLRAELLRLTLPREQGLGA